MQVKIRSSAPRPPKRPSQPRRWLLAMLVLLALGVAWGCRDLAHSSSANAQTSERADSDHLGSPPLCEASAALPWPSSSSWVLVADNEHNKDLFLFGVVGRRLEERGRVALSKPWPHDIEALASRDDELVVVGSHSRNKAAELKAKRQRISRYRMSGSQNPEELKLTLTASLDSSTSWSAQLADSNSCMESFLLDKLENEGQASKEVPRIPTRTAENDGEKLDRPLQELGRIPSRTAENDGEKLDRPLQELREAVCTALVDANAGRGRAAGIDIEGAAFVGEHLWLGLRSPQVDGRALLLRVQADEQRLLFDGAALLDSDGLGVRELSARGQELWVVLGPGDEQDGPFRLHSLDATKLAPGERLATTLLAELPKSTEALLAFDDGVLALTDGARASKKACDEPARQLFVSF